MGLKLSERFFWWEWLDKMIFAAFWWVILFIIILWVPFLRVWWWAFLPLMLSAQLKTLYLWWIGWDFDYAKQKWVILEVIPPKEVLIPIKAMEDVFATVWPIYDNGNFREVWCDGELQWSPYWFSFEMASIEGTIHFYLRFMRQNKNVVETALYGHYPDIEIHEVEDYTKLVPQNIPNDEWNMYGEDYIFTQPNAIPLRTYEKFFEPQGERISAEEKRIDPIFTLLESMARLGPGEHLWVQYVLYPVTDKDEPEWMKEGKSIVDKIAKRPEKKKEPTLWEDLANILGIIIKGPEKEGSGESAKYSWATEEDDETGERQISLTPGERDLITEIENKMKKPVFKTALRAVYVAKRENWRAPNRVAFRSYVAHFTLSNFNRLSWSNKTRPRVHYFMRNRRVFLRARKMFRMTVLRFPTLFPDRRAELPIFSTEELASMYHFPIKVAGMAVGALKNVESKKAGPPPNLPVEE
jgi:hypothetical protein